MPYTVTITEQKNNGGETEVFRQTVEALDLQAVFSAINKKPRKPRVRKQAEGAQQ